MKQSVTRIGVREAETHLSRLLREVQHGSEFVITDHGRPVGKLIPVPQEERSSAQVMRDLEARGIVEKRLAAPKPLGRPIRGTRPRPRAEQGRGRW